LWGWLLFTIKLHFYKQKNQIHFKIARDNRQNLHFFRATKFAKTLHQSFFSKSKDMQITGKHEDLLMFTWEAKQLLISILFVVYLKLFIVANVSFV